MRFSTRKEEELLCYLLLHAKRRHSRENLAELLWDDVDGERSRTYLRKALWRLRRTLDKVVGDAAEPYILATPSWIQLNPRAEIWVDATVFYQRFNSIRHIAGEQLQPEAVALLEDAAALYRSDLLDGWSLPWCAPERECLRNAYFSVLDKLMTYDEARANLARAIGWGQRILRHDRARECTHRHLMRLHQLAGDHGGALRQYETCVNALREELDVGPSDCTLDLCARIRGENRATDAAREISRAAPARAAPEDATAVDAAVLRELWTSLMQIQQSVVALQGRLQHELNKVAASKPAPPN